MVFAALPRQIRILLIESDRETIDLIEDVFFTIERETEFSISCQKYLSLNQAISCSKESQKIDIILLDLFLKDSQGIETLKAIKKCGFEPPIIVLGNSETEKLYSQILEFGAQDYLIKDCLSNQILIRSFTYAIERKKMQNALQKSEEKYRLIIDSIKEVIFQIDLSGNWLFLSSAWTNITGFSVPETLGKPAIAYIHPDYIARHKEEFHALISGKKKKTIYNLCCFCAGINRHCHLKISASTTLSSKGEISGISGTFDDMTDYQQQQEKSKSTTAQMDSLTKNIPDTIHQIFQSKNALFTQQELLLKIIQTSPNTWYFYDFKTQEYLYLNQSLRKMLDYSSEEFYDRYLHFQLIHPDDIKELETYFEQLASSQDGENFTIEYRMRHKSGNWHWLLSRDIIFSRQSDGNPDKILGTIMDITELKENEIQLQENQNRLQLALENSNLGLWDWDLSTGKVIYSEQWKQLIGYQDEEIEGDFSRFEKLVHPEDLPRVLKTVENHLKGDNTNRIVQVDFRMQTKEREWKWFVSQGKVTAWDEKGHPLQMIGTTKDISDRKQTELELRLFLSAARAINNARDFQDAIAIILPLFCQTIDWDVAEAWIPINKGENLQYVRGGYAKKTELQEFIDLSQILDCVPNIGFAGKIYRLREPEWIEDISLADEGSFYRQEMAANVGLKACFGIPILKNKRVLAILVFFKTIPLICDLHLVDLVNVVAAQLGEFMQRKKIEERALNKTRQLREALQQLKRSQARAIHNEKMTALGKLVAGVAHEINNPISFIYGNITPALNYAEELLALVHLYQKHYPHPVAEVEEAIAALDLEFMEADFLKLLESMQTGATRIRDLVKSLRNFSRLHESDRKYADLHEGLNNTLTLLQHRLKPQSDRPEIQVVKNFTDLPEIECYPGDLNQVFMNLFNNAIDALEEKWLQGKNFTPTLTLNTEVGQYRDSQQTYVRIHIADNGAGIPQHLQLRIFDPFFTTKSIGKGTGLGLTASHDIIVEKHGGRLYCASTVGEGTEFAIEIPFQ